MFAPENVSGDREQQFYSKNDFSKNFEIFEIFFVVKNRSETRKYLRNDRYFDGFSLKIQYFVDFPALEYIFHAEEKIKNFGIF